MKRSNELDNLLDACLERLFAGESIEACLASYPEQEAELRPLLEMAAGTRKAVDITPRPEFRQRAAMEFQSAIRDIMVPARQRTGFSLRHWWVGALAAIVLVVMAGGGTVAASSGSMPDGMLYGVKTATENARIALAFSTESKAKLYAQFADRRIDEIVIMAELGKVDEINQVTDKLNDQLIAMAGVFGADNGDMMLTFGATGGLERSASSKDAELQAPPPESTATPMPTMTAVASTLPPAEPEVVNQSGDASGEEPGMLQAETYITSETGDDVLLNIVINDAFSNSVKLQDAITVADDPIREALERALAVANQAYAYAISNIR